MTTYNEPRFPGPDPYEPLGNPPSFTLTSTDLADGAEIEEKFRAPSNISPQLQWSDLPEGTKSLAVTLLDPDAPTGAGFWHWAAFNIPADTTELPQGAGSAADLGIDGVISLKHDVSHREHYGTQPPAVYSPHRYLYSIHALDVETLDIASDSSPTVLGCNLYFHTLGRSILSGRYEQN